MTHRCSESGSSSSHFSTLAVSALDYAAQGWPVLPIKPRAKVPLTAHGVKDASADVRTVEQWWRRWPAANIGLAIPPGLVVLDLDSPDAWHRLKAQDRGLPSTVQARTARGAHFWYRVPGRARNRVGLSEGVDLRAHGGYVLAAPSVHPSGVLYAWRVPLGRSAIAEAPGWLIELLGESPDAAPQRRRNWHQTITGPVGQGRRNQTLAEVSGLLFRRLPASTAAELAYCWAQVKLRPPLPEREVRRTIDSIAGRELRRQGAHQGSRHPEGRR